MTHQPTPALVLDREAIAAITRHLDEDHAEDTLLLCRTLGGQPDATSARAVGVDADGLDLEAQVDGRPVPVRLVFDAPVEERAEVRHAVVALYERATDGPHVAGAGEDGR